MTQRLKSDFRNRLSILVLHSDLQQIINMQTDEDGPKIVFGGVRFNNYTKFLLGDLVTSGSLAN